MSLLRLITWNTKQPGSSHQEGLKLESVSRTLKLKSYASKLLPHRPLGQLTILGFYFYYVLNLPTEYNRLQMSFALQQMEKYKNIYLQLIEKWNPPWGGLSLWVSGGRLHRIILWTSTPVDTWGTAAGPAASSAISRCSACGNSGSTDPRPAGSHPQALYLQKKCNITTVMFTINTHDWILMTIEDIHYFITASL